MQFPYPVVLADIGGTNARFTIQGAPDAPLAPVLHLATAHFPTIEDAFVKFRAGLAVKPRSLIACVAGPVEGRKVKMTNAHWVIDGTDLVRKVGFDQGLILNDFEAQALSLPVLKTFLTIGDVPETRGGLQVILGPGTGLGAGALLEVEGRHVALASEAGHIDFGPIGSAEALVFAQVEPTAVGRIEAETLLSGPGLLRLHRARLAARGEIAPDIDEATIILRALADPRSEEAQTVQLFLALIARFSSDLALAFLATGGVTFAGGILPRLVEVLDAAAFRTAFENKPPYHDLLARIPTRLITQPDVVLAGMAAIAANPERYAIDYAKRAWV